MSQRREFWKIVSICPGFKYAFFFKCEITVQFPNEIYCLAKTGSSEHRLARLRVFKSLSCFLVNFSIDSSWQTNDIMPTSPLFITCQFLFIHVIGRRYLLSNNVCAYTFIEIRRLSMFSDLEHEWTHPVKWNKGEVCINVVPANICITRRWLCLECLS